MKRKVKSTNLKVKLTEDQINRNERERDDQEFQMKSRVDLLTKELDDKQEVLDKKMAELGKYCEDLEEERTRLESLLKQVEAEKTEVESLVIQMQEEIEAKDQDFVSLKETHLTEMQEMQREVEDLREEEDKRRAEIEDKERESRQLSKELGDFQEQMGKLLQENEKLESSLLKMEAEKAALKARMPGLVKKGELVEKLGREVEELKAKVEEGEVYIEEVEARKKEALREVLNKFKNIYRKTEKAYQRKDQLMGEKESGVVKSMMNIISAKKYNRKIRLVRMFGVLKDFLLSEENFMGFFSYIDKECSENEEGVEQMLKLFVNSYESIKQRVFELAQQIINLNPDFGSPEGASKKEDKLKVTEKDYSKNGLLREIIHNKFLMMSTKESLFVKDSVVKYMRRKKSGELIQKMFRRVKKGTLGISKEKFNSSFQKLDFCVFKAATGKSMIKEMLTKLGLVSRKVKEKLQKEEDDSDETNHDQSTIYVEFG